jgi:glutamine amidotransferase
MPRISIVDYGVGNIASVSNALAHVGVEAGIVSNPAELRDCGHVLLPGVGAFGPASDRLRAAGLVDALVEHATVRGRPLLGICLGMQLLMDRSSEAGDHRGLGLVAGSVEPLSGISAGLVVPHVGWNEVDFVRESPLADRGTRASFYFVHGYYCKAADPAHVVGEVHYGSPFPAVIAAGNVVGCQFHPEKSQRHGLAILERFSRM